MKFGYTILYVTDVFETIEFYKKAFGFTKKFISPEYDYGELVSGETALAFASLELGESNFKNGFEASTLTGKPFGIELAFISEQIEEDFQKAISSGALLVSPLIEKPWGQKVGYVKDNNGFLIEICSPIQG